MKKDWTYFFLGAGTAVAGLVGYALWREKTKQEADLKSEETIEPSAPQTSSQKFVLRRRWLLKRRSVERKPDTEPGSVVIHMAKPAEPVPEEAAPQPASVETDALTPNAEMPPEALPQQGAPTLSGEEAAPAPTAETQELNKEAGGTPAQDSPAAPPSPARQGVSLTQSVAEPADDPTAEGKVGGRDRGADKSKVK